MANKEQFMVLVTALDRARLDAMRIVTGVSRADVVRRLITQYLPRAEREQTERLARLSAVAGAAGFGSREEFVTSLVQRPEYRQKAPTLEELEGQYLAGQSGQATDLDTPVASGDREA